MKGMKQFSVYVTNEVYEVLNTMKNSTGKSLSDVTRDVINKGLAANWVDENKSLVAAIVKEQLEATLKPSVERLAALVSKTGHMAATSAYLNVQALSDLVPVERRKDPVELYEKARKKAVDYMKNKLVDPADNKPALSTQD